MMFTYRNRRCRGREQCEEQAYDGKLEKRQIEKMLQKLQLHLWSNFPRPILPIDTSHVSTQKDIH
jgi:hypothetical protein